MKKIFDGVVVVDLSNNVAGPNATAMLADYGAEIIKIEKPGIGDDNRAYGPFLEGKGLIGMGLNRGKKSIVLDTRKPEALDILRKLIEKADIIVETFRPGYMKKIGFAYEDIIKFKPDIIMCSVSGYGQTGPWGQKPGYDLMVQASSGLMDATGFQDGPPLKVGAALADFATSLTHFGALVSALYHKEKTGEGQYIDVCLLESIVSCLDFTTAALNNVQVPGRSGNHHATLTPFGLFKGNDGYVEMGAVSEKLWASLCKLMGKEELIDDPKYQGSGKRAEIQNEIVPMVEQWMQTFNTVDEVIDILDEAGIPCAKLGKIQDLINNPQLIARNMITEVSTPELSSGKVNVLSPIIHFSKTPGHVKFTPGIGEHTDEILNKYINYDEDVISKLKSKGIFG